MDIDIGMHCNACQNKTHKEVNLFTKVGLGDTNICLVQKVQFFGVNGYFKSETRISAELTYLNKLFLDKLESDETLVNQFRILRMHFSIPKSKCYV